MQRTCSQVLITIIVCLSLSSTAVAQIKSGRTITKAIIPHEPVKIIEARVGGETIDIGSKFAGDEDWLNGIRFKVKNMSGKTIEYLEINLYIPESVTDSYPFMIPVTFGKWPSASNNPNVTMVADKLQEGNEVEVAFSEEYYKHIRQIFARTGICKPISEVELRIGMTIFDDGTAWSEGKQLRRDADNPDNWVVFPLLNPGVKAFAQGGYTIINNNQVNNGTTGSRCPGT